MSRIKILVIKNLQDYFQLANLQIDRIEKREHCVFNAVS